jgi:hypothetical protein
LSLLDLFGRQSERPEQFDHYLLDNLCQGSGRREFGTNIKGGEKLFE